MITLSATISLGGSNSANARNSAQDNSFISAVATYNPNNISSNMSDILNRKSKGGKPFILGASKLDGKSTFSDGEDYFIGSVVANADGKFANEVGLAPYTITIKGGSKISALTIMFDTVNNQFPEGTIVVNNGAKQVDSPIVTISKADGSYFPEEFTIKISTWNTPNYPLRIQGIYANVVIGVDLKNMVSLDRAIMQRSDLKLPSWGIISNVANIEFNDNGDILTYANDGTLDSTATVDINLNNTLTKKTQRMGTFFSDTWSYDNDNRSVSVSLKDDLEEWQNIEGIYMPYDFEKANPLFFSDIYKFLYSVTPSKFNMLAYDDLDEKTKGILSQTRCEVPHLKVDNLWAQWEKLCVACQLYIHKNNNSRTVCSYELGA